MSLIKAMQFASRVRKKFKTVAGRIQKIFILVFMAHALQLEKTHKKKAE